MTLEVGSIGEASLRFYSRISASISHEIKNALAIINENAGLLEDFTAMAEGGRSIDPAKYKNLAGMISKQVIRASNIVNEMNKFAHTLDQKVANVDLNETLGVFFALINRSTEWRHVIFNFTIPSQSVNVKTAPFFLVAFLWDLFESAEMVVSKEASVNVTIEKVDQGARIIFRFVGFSHGPWETMKDRRSDDFIKLLNAEMAAGADNTEIIVNLPLQLDA